jgi:hypothetical protein
MRTEADGRRHKRNAASLEIFLHNGATGRPSRVPDLKSARVWQVLRWRRIDYTQRCAGAFQFRLIVSKP